MTRHIVFLISLFCFDHRLRYYLAPKGAAMPKVTSAPKSNPAPVRNLSLKSTIKSAPRGVPSLVRWKKNGDSSITGFISDSPRFNEGERITTSSITSGNIQSGEVVKTGSGSSYFLV